MATQSPINFLDTVRSITCRVEAPNNFGTGIMLPASNSDEAYLITAKHCLLGKDFKGEIQNSDVTVSLPSRDGDGFSLLTLDQNSQILLPSDAHLDIAVVIIKNRQLKLANIPLLDIRYFQTECFFRGYPRADDSLQGINISVNFVDNNVVTTQTPLETYNSISHDNCDGFSGSGVFGVIEDTPFFVGLLYELKEPFHRFNIYSLSQINSVLSEHGFPALPTSALPVDPGLQNDIRLLERKSTVVLESIKDTFDQQFHLPRESVALRFNDIIQMNQLVILKGEAGAGKSAFAKNQLKAMENEGYKILAFKADWFAKESVEEIVHGINRDLQDLLVALGATQQLIILIDSLEKLLEVDTYFALKEFLKICKDLPYISLIVTCRNYAYQQLIFDLHYDFPTYSFVDVPLLSDGELRIVCDHFSALTDLLDNPRFRTILRRPFYLSLVIRHKDVFPQDKTITELKFRELIWSHVIENGSQTRAYIFEQIAIERATRMSMFASLEGLDTQSLQALVRDGILEVDEITRDSYRPSHDIYEDIALIRYVTRAFQTKQNTEDFLGRIDGKTPAKRRGFRLWLNDALIAPESITGFIHDVFELQTTPRFWIDELIVAILHSEYCQTFLDHNERLLLENDQALLLRFIHLLRTTCQEPDEKLIQTAQNRDNLNLYQWLYIKPVGVGWGAVVNFVADHLSVLTQHKSLVLRFLTQDWSKKIQSESSLPVESSQVGMILFNILEEVKKCYKANDDTPYSTTQIREGLELIFQLSESFEKEVRNLIEEANTFTKKAKERYRSRNHRSTFLPDFTDDQFEETMNYHFRDFNQSIIKFVLSGLRNQAICLVMPDLVCRVAKDQWLTDEDNTASDNHSLMDRGIVFGFANFSDLDYFPSGIYKTPIRFLLYSHPEHALKLIVDIFNHCTEAYTNSPRGKRSNVVEIEVVQNDGTSVFQKGNPVLWGMFRGMVEATDYLLESILMSLESWLLELCESNEDWADGWISTSYRYLLKTSTSVAVTAVLASVAQAYPHRVGSLCFPILRVRDFFRWDIRRLVGDGVPLAILDARIPFAQAEKHRSNQLPHRKNHLEFLVTKLQIEKFPTEMDEIIDEHARRCDQSDIEWKLALNRMDARKIIMDETAELPAENQIVLRSVIDEELQDFVDRNAEIQDIQSRAMGIVNWAMKVYNGEIETDSSYEKWHEAFNEYHALKKGHWDLVESFLDPAPLAATGIKKFKGNASSEQLRWCVEKLIEVVMERLGSNLHRAPYSSIYTKPAIETIPDTLSMDISDELKSRVKQVIFVALLYLVTNESEYPFESFRNTVWKTDSEYADACVAGIIRFARLFKKRKWLSPNHAENHEENREFLEQVEILAEQVSANEIEIDLKNLTFATCSSHYLGFAVQIIQFDTDNADYHKFLYQLFHLHIEWNNVRHPRRQSEDLNYETQRELQDYIAKFVLLQKNDIGQIFFADILDTIFVHSDSVTHDSVKYVEEILEYMLIKQDSLQSESFWNLWEILAERIRQSDRKRYVSYLLLSHRWWNANADNWKPLQNKSLTMRRMVIEFGKYDFKATLQLLSGIGTEVLMPDGLNWLRMVLQTIENPTQELIDSDVFFYSEKLIQRTYYKYLREVKRDRQLQQSLLVILDLLVDVGSSLAFIVRERLIIA